MFKGILFLIDVYYEELIGFEMNETLKFFSELKTEERLMDKLYSRDFKAFVGNLVFDEDVVRRLKIKYEAIADEGGSNGQLER